jgi:XTP/dITP diphosphohydrolase
LVLATRNGHKVRELSRILAEAGLDDLEIVDLTTFPDVPDVPETGTTFAENAALKARAVARATGLPAVADDSGLCVDVLGGAPGVFSARWAGRHGDDEANLDLLLAQLSDVPDHARTAHFACAAVLALPDGTVEVAEGQVEGSLIRERRGHNGFGYDPIFLPDGHRRTTAEMSAEQKDAISHRGRAFRALVPTVRQRVTAPSAVPRTR